MNTYAPTRQTVTEEEQFGGKSITELVSPQSDSYDKVSVTITNEIVGYTRVFGFSKETGRSKNEYLVPLYKVIASSTDNNGNVTTEAFKAIRYGVKEEVGSSPKMVGLSDEKAVTSSQWFGEYNDLGLDSRAPGAWKISGPFKIIAGLEDTDDGVGEAYGHIEIAEADGFKRLNNFILKQSKVDSGGSSGHQKIIDNGLLSINIQKAERPNLIHLTPDKDRGLHLKITNKPVGYTIQHIYGPVAPTKETIVVPAYELQLINPKDASQTKYYRVSRDSWYSRGRSKGNPGHWDLTNRAFEPLWKSQIFDTRILPYPNQDTDAFELAQLNRDDLDDGPRKVIDATPFTEEQNTFINKREIDDARTNLNQATSVMLHIGGYYNHYDKGDVLSGSYGCFGLVPDDLFFTSKAEAQKLIDNNTVHNTPLSNSSYKAFVDVIKAMRGSDLSVSLEIEQRQHVEKFKTVDRNGQ